MDIGRTGLVPDRGTYKILYLDNIIPALTDHIRSGAGLWQEAIKVHLPDSSLRDLPGALESPAKKDKIMILYEVGQIVEQFRNHQEGTVFDLDDCGGELRVYISHPTQDEIQQFTEGSKFEIRMVELYGVIMLSLKFGNLPWADAPYTPHLSKNLTRAYEFEAGQGIALTLLLIDAATGEIKHMRLIGLPERFSRKLFAVIEEHRKKHFDKAEYARAIDRIYSTYSTKQLAKMGDAYH